MTLAAEWHVDEPAVRVTEGDVRAALRAVTGKPVIPARARLRFGPGRTCEAIARLLDRAIVRAEAAGLDPRLLVVAEGRADAGDDIVRVRRKAHGVADWIHSPTCRPLTGVLEDQIRAGLVPLGCVDDFRVDWQWIPAWRPADITDSGREQLRAIGFTI